MLIRLISLAILLLLIDVNHIGLADGKFILPKDKPSVFKKIEKNKTEIKELVPQNKPNIKTKEKVLVKKDIKKKQITEKEEKKKIEVRKEVEIEGFVIPQKKPKTVKKAATPVKKSKYLSQKDFERAKIAFDQIKSGKVITGYKTSQKIKDKDFKKRTVSNILLKKFFQNYL